MHVYLIIFFYIFTDAPAFTTFPPEGRVRFGSEEKESGMILFRTLWTLANKSGINTVFKNIALSSVVVDWR